MASTSPPPRTSLKDIARRVGVAHPPSTATAAPRGGDTVRPVALSAPPPVPPDHPALAELAQICERSIQEGIRRNQAAGVASSTAGRCRKPVGKRWTWSTILPIAGGVVVAVAAMATSAVVLTRARTQQVDAHVAPAVPSEANPARPDPAARTIAQSTPAQPPGAVDDQRGWSAPLPREPARLDKHTEAASPVARPQTGPSIPAAGAESAPPAVSAAEPAPAGSNAPAEEPRSDDPSAAVAAAATGSAPAESATAPAEDEKADDSSKPEAPSQGALQAALSGPREAAKACVVGMDEPSRATVVFESGGGVASVAVSGPAQGQPAESCIRAALAGARVAPFRKESFSVGFTLRP